MECWLNYLIPLCDPTVMIVSLFVCVPNKQKILFPEMAQASLRLGRGLAKQSLQWRNFSARFDFSFCLDES